jgi:PAS domain S-box-containing protein
MEGPFSKKEPAFRTLVENSLTGIYINLEERIVFANKRFAHIFGYTAEDVVGMHYLDFVHPEDRPKVEAVHRKRLSGEAAPPEYESRGLTREGRTIWIYRRNTRIVFEGKPAILGNMVDITRQKQLQEKLLQMEKLASLGTFTAGVAHELNNPFNNISSSLQIILEEWDSGDDAFKKSLLHDVEDQVERGQRIIRALFDFSRAEAMDVEPVNFLQVVEQALKRIRSEIPECIQIDVEVPADMEARLSYEHMQQVLINLVLNGVQAMEEDGGRLRISAFCDGGGQSFCFSVADTGEGIAESALKKVFDPFYTTKEPSKGMGLGLSIAHGIVQQHGGKIEVSSRPGEGSTFTVCLPNH